MRVSYASMLIRFVWLNGLSGWRPHTLSSRRWLLYDCFSLHFTCATRTTRKILDDIHVNVNIPLALKSRLKINRRFQFELKICSFSSNDVSSSSAQLSVIRPCWNRNKDRFYQKYPMRIDCVVDTSNGDKCHITYTSRLFQTGSQKLPKQWNKVISE